MVREGVRMSHHDVWHSFLDHIHVAYSVDALNAGQGEEHDGSFALNITLTNRALFDLTIRELAVLVKPVDDETSFLNGSTSVRYLSCIDTLSRGEGCSMTCMLMALRATQPDAPEDITHVSNRHMAHIIVDVGSRANELCSPACSIFKRIPVLM